MNSANMNSAKRQRRYWERVLNSPEARVAADRAGERKRETLVAMLNMERKQVADLRKKLQAKRPRSESEEAAGLERQLRSEIANLRAKARALSARLNAQPHNLTRALHKEIRACLHPDRVNDPELKKRFEKAFVAFSELKFKFLD
jgi:hypothetical protein